MGGILFIDEEYSFSPSTRGRKRFGKNINKNNANQDTVDTLVKLGMRGREDRGKQHGFGSMILESWVIEGGTGYSREDGWVVLVSESLSFIDLRTAISFSSIYN